MSAESTARLVLPGNRTNSIPDLTITDSVGERVTLWDFTNMGPERQTLEGAEGLMAKFGWRAVGWESGGRAMWWRERGGWWTLRVETCEPANG